MPLPGEHRAQPVGDVGVVVEAEHRVCLRQRLGELIAVPLGHAADRDHRLGAARSLEVGSLEQGVDRVLLGRLDEPAGVDETASASSASATRWNPSASSRAASSSESTSLRAQPRVTIADGRRVMPSAPPIVTRIARASRSDV